TRGQSDMKARKILLRTAGVIAALYAVLYVVRFQTTLPIEGVVVDAKTGKPVSKVLVHASWHFSYSNLVDTTGGGFGYGTVTGEDGKFRIPRKNVTVVFGRFDDQSLMVKHPLYEFLDKQVYSQMGKEYRAGTVQDGVVRLTLSIQSLEDKYSGRQDLSSLSRAMDDCGPEFYRSMRDDYHVKYDLGQIMSTLKRLSERFPDIPPDENPVYLAYRTHEFRMRDFMKSY
ncbi:MAG TPA: hypothetical protein VN317_10115, partial [Candidatus Methanoperedens sp.]|nr:hypothetical protein [Candidatus Methanoperedens sp.]